MIRNSRSMPELLAPAGNPEALRAAVANGADAVYLGLDMFNARRSAENFTLETLPETCRFAHLSGVKIYLTVNILILPGEFVDALEMIDRAWEAGVDAVIIQDLGLLDAVAQLLPHVRIHASTQMGAHDSETIRVMSAAGVSRVTLAREVSLREIRDFAKLGVEVESFGHGAICVCYSGQCLMSSLIGRRSANRGMCAQPCRLPWELLDERGQEIPVPGEHLLSPKDLATIGLLPDLVASGVSAIKIEGRMKSAEYVAVVTAAYRAALDRASADPHGFEVEDDEMQALSEAFSRGFTEAYLVGERGNEMMGYKRPNNRGVQVARIGSLREGVVTLAVEKDLRAADTIEFWTGRGRFAQKVGPMIIDGESASFAPAGSKPQVVVEKAISPGDRVFRVRNSALSAAAEETYRSSKGRARALRITVEMRIGKPLVVTVADQEGTSGRADGAMVEAARTKSITRDEVVEHVGRLGGTPYVVEEWDIDLDEGVGIGFSTLHKVRRLAIETYEQALVAPWESRTYVPFTLPRRDTKPRAQTSIRTVVVVDSIESARRCLAAGADEVCAPLDLLVDDDSGLPITPILPRICHDDEFARAMSVVREGRPVVAGTLGLLDSARAAGAVVAAEWSLNAVNPATVDSLGERGAELVWLSPELSGRQIGEVCAGTRIPMGLTVSGFQEVMVTEHCMLMSQGPCDQDCAKCARRARPHSLRDRKEYLFPVRTDLSGRTHIFNSVPLDLTGAMAEVVEAGVSAIRVDTTLLKPHQAVAALERARLALTSALSGVEPALRDSETPTTSGHFFRGVL